MPNVTLAHGGGGKAMHDLIDDIFVEMFDNERSGAARRSGAAQSIGLGGTWRSTCFHHRFLRRQATRFPGGNIGKLAICGTVNDLAVGGAIPLYLSCSVIIEEGLPVETCAWSRGPWRRQLWRLA